MCSNTLLYKIKRYKLSFQIKYSSFNHGKCTLVAIWKTKGRTRVEYLGLVFRCGFITMLTLKKKSSKIWYLRERERHSTWALEQKRTVYKKFPFISTIQALWIPAHTEKGGVEWAAQVILMYLICSCRLSEQTHRWKNELNPSSEGLL